MILAMLLGVAQAATPRPLLDCGQIERAAMTSREEGVPEPKHATDVQLMASHSLCHGWEIIDMWRSGYAASGVWRARRKVMDPLGRLTVTTTDAAACPALIGVLKNLNDVPTALSVIPATAPAHSLWPPIVWTDGTGYTLKLLSSDQPDGSSASITMSSNDGALAHWAEASIKQLEPCWRPAA